MAFKKYVLNGKRTLDRSVLLKNLENLVKNKKSFSLSIPPGDDIEDKIITILEKYNVLFTIDEAYGEEAVFKAGVLKSFGEASYGTAGWFIADGVIKK